MAPRRKIGGFSCGKADSCPADTTLRATAGTYSRLTIAAARLLGQRIRIARKKKRWSERQLAERAGVARATVQKIERGDLGSSIGRVFELAVLAGVPLFEPDADQIRRHLARGEDILSLLPKHTHPKRREVQDDF